MVLVKRHKKEKRKTDYNVAYNAHNCEIKTDANEKALKCKPSALIFGRGRAKKSIALQGSYNIGI